MKCGEEWMAWESPCKRDGLPLILNIHDCGFYGRMCPGVLDTWPFCGFGKVII